MEIRPIGQSAATPQAGEGGAPALADGQVLVAKVMSVQGKSVEVMLDGRKLQVQTSVPLSPGDEMRLLVHTGKQGQTRLEVVSLKGEASLMSEPHLAALVEKMGLPSDKATLDSAKALFAQTGTVNPEQVKELARLGSLVKDPADRAGAAFLLSRGIVVTPEALAAVTGRTRTQESAGKRLADRAKLEKIDLEGLQLNEGDANALVAGLEKLIKAFTPAEAQIARLLRDGLSLEGARDGNVAANLPGDSELGKELRFQQLDDATRGLQGRTDATEVRIPLMLGRHPGEVLVQKWKGNPRDPEDHTRLLVSLDMDYLGPISVDLMMHNRQVGGRLLVSDPQTREFLADRLGRLRDGLSGIGISVTHLDVGTPQDKPDPPQPRARFDVKL